MLTIHEAQGVEREMLAEARARGLPDPVMLVGRELNQEKVDEVWASLAPALQTDGKFDIEKLKMEMAVSATVVSHYYVVMSHLTGGQLRSVRYSPEIVANAIEATVAQRLSA